MVLVALLVIGLRLAVGGESSGGPARAGAADRPAVAGASPCRVTRPRDLPLTVTAPDGRVRTALVHVPAGLRRPAPLILAFHGAGGNGPFMQRYSGLSPVAQRAGMVVAYPTADPARRRWTLEDDRAGAADDVGFARVLLAALERRGCADPTRVYATGVSNGGGLVALLACDPRNGLAAIAPVAGGYGTGPCEPERLVSVLEIHGVADTVVPYRGRPPERDGAVRPWLARWARRDGCPGPPARRAIAPRTVRFDWSRCAAPGVTVSHIAVLGGEHAWPGATPPDKGPPSTISAAREIVAFFSGRRLGERR
jgi:polyhydroxybutyrate depolymerase